MKKMIVTGNVGKDPELRVDNAGNPYATFSIGVSVGTKAVPKTDWVDISCNGKLADFVKVHVKKGSKVLIDGFPTVAAYLNNKSEPSASQRIFANTIELMGSRPEGEAKNAAEHDNNVTDDIADPEEPAE